MSVTVRGSSGGVTVYGGGARMRGFSLAIDPENKDARHNLDEAHRLMKIGK